MRPHRTEDGLLERISVGLGQSRDTNSKIVVHAWDTIMTLASENGWSTTKPEARRARSEGKEYELVWDLRRRALCGACGLTVRDLWADLVASPWTLAQCMSGHFSGILSEKARSVCGLFGSLAPGGGYFRSLLSHATLLSDSILLFSQTFWEKSMKVLKPPPESCATGTHNLTPSSTWWMSCRSVASFFVDTTCMYRVFRAPTGKQGQKGVRYKKRHAANVSQRFMKREKRITH